MANNPCTVAPCLNINPANVPPIFAQTAVPCGRTKLRLAREEETRHRFHLSRGAIAGDEKEKERHVDRDRDSRNTTPRASVRTSTKHPETQSRLTPPPFEEPNDDPPGTGNPRPVSAPTRTRTRTRMDAPTVPLNPSDMTFPISSTAVCQHFP